MPCCYRLNFYQILEQKILWLELERGLFELLVLELEGQALISLMYEPALHQIQYKQFYTTVTKNTKRRVKYFFC